MGGIYVHIPFCRKACHYCNFHFSTSLNARDPMIQAICTEIEMTEGYLSDNNISSIYFGGGTPSILNKEELFLIMDRLRSIYNWKEEIEITLEANAEDIHSERLDFWAEAGINRLSMGVQSFHNEDLIPMNRSHDAVIARKSLDLLARRGDFDISIDLIYGSPTTTQEMWEENVDIFLNYNIDHLSAYCLTVEEGTALHHHIKTKKTLPPDPEKSIEQYDYLMDKMETQGYEHYEISSWARDGKYALHNGNYWKHVSYLGIGPSAHSYNGLERKWNVAHNVKYLSSIESGTLPYESELLSETNLFNEKVMTQLRTMWGIDIDGFKEKEKEHLRKHIPALLRDGLVSNPDNRIVLTRKGKHMADYVSAELIRDEDD